MDETALIIAGLIVGVLLIIVALLICRYRQRQRKSGGFYGHEEVGRTPSASRSKQKKGAYKIKDNFSVLESEVRFPDSSKAKAWIGKSGITELQKEQATSRLKAQYDAYSDAMKVATNFCRAAVLNRKIRDSLPCVGARNDTKFYYPIVDEKLDKNVRGDSVLLVHIYLNKCPAFNSRLLASVQKNKDNTSSNETWPLGTCRCIDFSDETQFRAFKFTMETLKHPYLANTYDVEISRDKEHLFLFQDLEKNGSLRDYIYGQDLSRPYDEKYSRPGQPLDLNTIRRYGRQILEAMQYLASCGVVNYHLHTGNVIISSTDGDVYLTNIENNFLGLTPKHPYHKYLIQLKKLYPELVVELCLFGYVLFEMASGMQSPGPSPLDCLHELPKKLPSPVVEILGRIFGDKSIGTAQQISDLMDDPLFVAKNAPPLEIESYLALRKENEHVEYLRDASTIQCLQTYSDETLKSNRSKNLQEHTNKSPGKKKKKKKKVKNKDALGEPLLPEAGTASRKSKVKPRKGSDEESGLTVKDLLSSPKDDALALPPKFREEYRTNEKEIPKQPSPAATKQTKQPLQPASRLESSSEGSETDEEEYFP